MALYDSQIDLLHKSLLPVLTNSSSALDVTPDVSMIVKKNQTALPFLLQLPQ